MLHCGIKCERDDMRFGKKKSKDVKTKPSVENTNKNEEQIVETAVQEEATKLNDRLVIEENDGNTKKSAKDREKENKKKEKKDKKASKV